MNHRNCIPLKCSGCYLVMCTYYYLNYERNMMTLISCGVIDMFLDGLCCHGNSWHFVYCSSFWNMYCTVQSLGRQSWTKSVNLFKYSRIHYNVPFMCLLSILSCQVRIKGVSSNLSIQTGYIVRFILELTVYSLSVRSQASVQSLVKGILKLIL